jgi:hypothetical protein
LLKRATLTAAHAAKLKTPSNSAAARTYRKPFAGLTSLFLMSYPSFAFPGKKTLLPLRKSHISINVLKHMRNKWDILGPHSFRLLPNRCLSAIACALKRNRHFRFFSRRLFLTATIFKVTIFSALALILSSGIF